MMVPVLRDSSSRPYYVAFKRDGPLINCVQLRLDSKDRCFTVFQRAVRVPAGIAAAKSSFVFVHREMTGVEIRHLVWDAFFAEAEAEIDGLLLSKVHYRFWTDVAVSTSLSSNGGSIHFNETQIARLSIALQEAAALMDKGCTVFVPFVETPSGRRGFTLVSLAPPTAAAARPATTIRLASMNEECKLFKVEILPSAAGVTLPDLSGLVLRPANLPYVDRVALVQKLVDRYWYREGITPVVDSARFFAQNHFFSYISAGIANLVMFNAQMGWRIQEGIARVCCSGGVTKTLVPVGVVSAPPGPRSSFIVIGRRLRDVEIYLAYMDHNLQVVFWTIGYSNSIQSVFDFVDPSDQVQRPGLVFDSTLDGIQSMPVAPSPSLYDRAFARTLFWDALYEVWDRRYDSLTIVQRPALDSVGTFFRYYPRLPGGTVSRYAMPLGAVDATRIEKVLRAMLIDPSMRAFLVPLPGERPRVSFAAIVRNGLDQISSVLVWSTGETYRLEVDNFDVGVVFTLAHIIAPEDMSVLFEKPIDDFWTADNYAKNLHSRARDIALCMALHPRLGEQADVRILGNDMVRLCLGFGKAPLLA